MLEDSTEGPPEAIGNVARDLLRNARPDQNGLSWRVEGWRLTAYTADRGNEREMARLWKLWWKHVENESVFFGVPDDGVFVAAQKM